jgi:hypothetical protein
MDSRLRGNDRMRAHRFSSSTLEDEKSKMGWHGGSNFFFCAAQKKFEPP